jgi:hypothetical protein
MNSYGFATVIAVVILVLMIWFLYKIFMDPTFP